jgi:hypothetical protein
MSKPYLSVARKFVSGMMKIHSLYEVIVLPLPGVIAISMSGHAKHAHTSTGTPKPTISNARF